MPSAILHLRNTAGDKNPVIALTELIFQLGKKWVKLYFHLSMEPLWASELKWIPTFEKLLEHEKSEPCYSLM